MSRPTSSIRRASRGELRGPSKASARRKGVVNGPLRYLNNQKAAGIRRAEWDAYRDGVASAETVDKIERAHDALMASTAAPAAPAADQDVVLVDLGDMPKLREQRQLTQDALAELVGTSRGSIALIETGKRTPSPEMHAKISRALAPPTATG